MTRVKSKGWRKAELPTVNLKQWHAIEVCVSRLEPKKVRAVVAQLRAHGFKVTRARNWISTEITPTVVLLGFGRDRPFTVQGLRALVNEIDPTSRVEAFLYQRPVCTI